MSATFYRVLMVIALALVGVKYQACLTVSAQNLFVAVCRYLIQINFAFSEVPDGVKKKGTALQEHISSFFALALV